MPPEPLMDVRTIDQSCLAVPRRQIYQVNPHRHEFALLDGIFFIDEERKLMAGYLDAREDQWWARGHIPGRPLLPGVLMIEASAQLVSYYVMSRPGFEGFLGFGGVEGVKFRGQVRPGDRLIIVAHMKEMRGKRRNVADCQGFVGEQMVYEGRVTGMVM